jgi:glutamate racemase
MSQKDSPLGIFDSGIGGLTVLKKVLEELPHEDIIYLGDTARLPYGDKSPSAIVRFSLQNASFLASHAIKLLVVACNTASAYAVNTIREKHPLPVIDVIEPAVEHAVKMTSTKKIAVLGTRATINSRIYPQKINERLTGAEVVSLACPLFVPLVEEGYQSHPASALIIKEYLKPIISREFDRVILGCTHYPILLSQIQEELGKDVTIIDSASVCAKKVVEALEKQNLKKNVLHKGNRKYYASDDTDKFRRLGKHFLGLPIENVETFIFDEVS